MRGLSHSEAGYEHPGFHSSGLRSVGLAMRGAVCVFANMRG